MEAATAPQIETVRFVSRHRNYRSVLLSPIDHPHPITGAKVVTQRGFTAEFARQPFKRDAEQDVTDGSFQWPPPPNDPEAPYVNEDGHYVDPISNEVVDVVTRLREHEDFELRYTELGPTPEEVQEAQRAVLGEILKATRGGNADRLAEIYEAEEQGQKRDPILSAALEAMKAIEE